MAKSFAFRKNGPPIVQDHLDSLRNHVDSLYDHLDGEAAEQKWGKTMDRLDQLEKHLKKKELNRFIASGRIKDD